MSSPTRKGKRFAVGLSFPGEKREYVFSVAESLASTLGKARVFYDNYYDAELAQPDLDTYLQAIYHDDSELIVIFLCREYEKKEWCRLEWRAIRDLIKKRNTADIMPFRFDDAHVPGLFSFDGYVDASKKSPEAAAKLILQRLDLNRSSQGGSNEGPDGNAAPIHNLPERNRHFTGRVEVLEKIARALDAESSVAGLTQVQGLSGLGGIGKSQTALEFAHRHLGNPYRYIFWVQADTEGEIIRALGDIARRLDLPEKDAQDANIAVQAARTWLETNPDWLLVFDNVEPDGQAMVRRYFPCGGTGRILVTSRAHALDALDIPKPIPLDKMNPSEARDFLVERTGNNGTGIDTAPVDAVAKALDYLPLALEQAAAYIIDKSCTFTDYLKSFDTRRKEYLGFKSKAAKYPDSVATTWLLNFEQVADASKAARDLLYLCAFLDPDRIPLEILRDGAAELGPELAPALADAADDPMALNDVLHPLIRYSLIRRLEAESFTIHRLVQDIVRAQLTDDDQRVWAERAVLAVNAAFPDIEFSNWPRCERLLPHARLAAGHVERYAFASGEASRLLNQTGYYLRQRAQNSEAEPMYRWALAIAEASYGPEHPDVAIRLNNLALLLQATNRLAEAEPMYRRALAIDEAAYGSESPRVALRLNNLALLLQATNRLGEAEPMYRRALAIDEASYGPEHPDVAPDLNNLAALLKATNRLAEAEPLMRRALAIDEASYGPEHPTVAIRLNNLAALLKATNRLGDAEPLMRRVIAIFEKALGQGHPKVASALNNLAQLLQATNRIAEAEPLMRRALAIYESSYGPEHPDVASALNNLARLLKATNRLAEAEPLMRRALDVFRKFGEATGYRHPHMYVVVRNYLGLLFKMGLSAEDALAQVMEASGLTREQIDEA